MRITLTRFLLAALGTAAFTASASAQVLGTFSWQMLPYCNVITLTVTTVPTGFTLDGSDNQCGAPTKGSANGSGIFNLDGSVSANFTIVTSPSGQGVQVSAQVSPASGQGFWTDSGGNSGTFAFFGSVPGLPARPLPAIGSIGTIGPNVITTVQIAPGTVGVSDINTAEVQARVSGTCPAGQAVAGVNTNGTVICQSAADLGGAMKRIPTGNIIVPNTAVSFATAFNAATLTFTSPVNGTALLVARGFCNITSPTSGGGNLVIGTALPGETTVNTFSDWVSLRVPVVAAASPTQMAYSAERDVPVTAGVPLTATLKTYRETTSTEPMICNGSYRVTIHPTLLP